MVYEQKELSGSLFKNKDKKSEKHSDYNGSALIDGVEFWVNGWINTIGSGDKQGEKYMNLKFKRKDQQQGGGSSQGSIPDDDPF